MKEEEQDLEDKNISVKAEVEEPKVPSKVTKPVKQILVKVEMEEHQVQAHATKPGKRARENKDTAHGKRKKKKKLAKQLV